MTTLLKSALYASVAGLLMTSGAALAQSTQGNPGTTSPGTSTPGATSPSPVPGTTSPGVIAPDPTTPDPTAPDTPPTVDPYSDISPEAGPATGSTTSGTEEESMTGKSRYQRDKDKEREERELRQNPPTQGPEL